MSIFVAVTVAFLTALSVELIKTGKEIFVPPRRERLERRKSATLLAHWLEAFASRCLSSGGLTETFVTTNKDLGEVGVIPELGGVPTSVDLTLFSREIIAEVCALEIDVEQARDRLTFETQLGDELSYYDLLVRQCYTIGGRAQEIADLIRSKSGLKTPVSLTGFDYRDEIRKAYEGVNVHRSPSEDR